ncbi:hypothetical protein XENOCAPTIV_016881 [Xenoophorus captivus]|uniref:Uncharacterized protein n=1 Tax=Xenoophorus captivus TaxID=1517983 RepID=A0ABV0SFR0_9TELE
MSLIMAKRETGSTSPVVRQIDKQFLCTEGEHREHVTVPLRDVLEQHKSVLQTQLASLLQGKENIESSCSFTEHALSHGSATEILLVQKQMGERVSALARHSFPEHPHENGHLKCQVETDGLRRSIQNLGVLITTGAVGHTSVATGEGLRHAVVGQHTTITVTTKDKDGELVKSGNAVLKAEIVSADGVCTEAEVVDNKNGTYEVGYSLRSEGEFTFSLLLYEQPVRGSPFRLRAVKLSDVLQSPEDVKRRVKSPSGGGGHVRQKAVRRPSSMYSTTKKKENPIEDELIYRVGQLQRPTGVTVDMNGDIIVADYDNRWISIFSSDGKFKNKIGAGRLMGPKGVAVDKNGHIIAVDNKACCVFIFQSNGKLVTKFGARGTSERHFAEKSGANIALESKLSKSGPLFSPHFVAVNNKNEIVVTDFHNHSVKVRPFALISDEYMSLTI